MAYDAFISYSQTEDARISIAIQDGLHRLAKRWDELSSLRIFRDGSNMQLKSIMPSLEEALDESRYLIYLACPKAAKSGWVIDELETFLRNKDEQHILIILTKGDLVWDNVVGRFKHSDSSAFPELHKNYFSKEPLFLDLRWASDEKDLSLSNPKFLNAIATIAATLKNIPKDKLTGTLIEEQQRLRRNQRINLSFRGAFGFGIIPFLLFLWAMFFGFTSDAILSDKMVSYLFLLLGFPTAGTIGALSCGVRWRGAIGFALGFLLLLPIYMMVSILPFSNVCGDYTLLVLLTLIGYLITGTIGAAFCTEIPWWKGRSVFIWGGLICAGIFILIRGSLPEGIHTPVVSDVWFLSRLSILAHRSLDIAGDLFSERYYAVLIPLVASCIVSGFLFGLQIANARIKLPLNFRKPFAMPRQLQHINRNRFFKISVAIILLAVILLWTYMSTKSYQTKTALSVVKAEARTPHFENIGDKDWEQEFFITLRCRKILNERGYHSEAMMLSLQIQKGIRQFGHSTSLFFDRYVSIDGPLERFALIASYVKQFGEPGELDSLLNIAHGAVKEANILAIAEVGHTEILYGHRSQALETFQLGKSLLQKNDQYEASFLAQGYYAYGDILTSTKLLKSISNYAMTAEESSLIGFSDDIFPSSGVAFWKTGVWKEMLHWKTDAGAAMLEVVASMCRDGQLQTALSTLRKVKGSTSFWHSDAKLSGAAIEGEQYAVAFTVLDSLRATENPGWTDYDDEAEGIIAILKILKLHPNEMALQQAIERLESLEFRARKANLIDRFTGVNLCYAFALAGKDTKAIKLAEDLTEEKWNTYIMIASEIKDRNKSQSKSLLEKSWREAYLDHFGTYEPNEVLNKISETLISIGSYHKAQIIVDDKESLETCLLILEFDQKSRADN
ncbi:MAG: toll/interleukin-1 receptor domain-containing protein [Ferruginibacter sp.]